MVPARALYAITTWVWDDDYEKEGLQEPEIYDDKAAANTAARHLMRRLADRLNPFGDRDEYNFEDNLDDEGLYRGQLEGGPHGRIAVEMCVYKVALNKASTRETAKRPLDNAKYAWAGENGADHDDGEEEGEEEEPKKPNKKAKPAPKKTSIKAGLSHTNRKSMPRGTPNSLAGVRLLFTGTFSSMDRTTSVATAKKFGADVVRRLEDTDYVVVGERAGPKKLQVMNELELETVTEAEFLAMLREGVGEDKRQRMANKRTADDEERPQTPPRPAKVARTAKGRGKRSR
ncbi:hypothetical protein CCM_02705 [Cordyceps militaris CM01]|uniref:BRCT domain-containing protein n=1 Tax=Cordyceps militaris (strain CM01) TaxID=983644 RepID=G3JB74_CORMM|nr:uncharacterized protein CCM_02705 [Cordyceps militaris CM01]EGX94434.1 hypothetical protein CCM_02705 [Cordyceps militaris CM01]